MRVLGVLPIFIAISILKTTSIRHFEDKYTSIKYPYNTIDQQSIRDESLLAANFKDTYLFFYMATEKKRFIKNYFRIASQGRFRYACRYKFLED